MSPPLLGSAEMVKNTILENAKSLALLSEIEYFEISFLSKNMGFKNEEHILFSGCLPDRLSTLVHIYNTENGIRAIGRPELLVPKH